MRPIAYCTVVKRCFLYIYIYFFPHVVWSITVYCTRKLMKEAIVWYPTAARYFPRPPTKQVPKREGDFVHGQTVSARLVWLTLIAHTPSCVWLTHSSTLIQHLPMEQSTAPTQWLPKASHSFYTAQIWSVIDPFQREACSLTSSIMEQE